MATKLEIQIQKIEDLQSASLGPVKVVWRHSIVTDHSVVVEKLVQRLSSEVRIFGYKKGCSESENHGMVDYHMVVWLSENHCRRDAVGRETSRQSKTGRTEWRRAVKQAVSDLLGIQFQLWYSATRHPQELQPPGSCWSVEPYPEGGEPVQFVGAFMQETEAERDIVWFGNITVGQKAHSGTAESNGVVTLEDCPFGKARFPP